MTMVYASGLPLDTLAEDIKARIEAGDRDGRKSEKHYQAARST